MDKTIKYKKLLKISFKDWSLLESALTHKSANQKKNNEKLEFLGDRVLGLVLSEKLIDLYPNEKEGVLDKRFAKMVNKKTCCSIAWSIDIQNYILMGDSKKKITIKDDKILSDACEALIGAVFVDRGFEFTRNFVLGLWKKELANSNITILDPKTKLQEYSLKKLKKLPVYRLLSTKGPNHNPTFKVAVFILGSKQFAGIGKSKQEAEQDAAQNLIMEKNIN